MATKLFKKSGHGKQLASKNKHELPACSKSTYPSAGSQNPNVQIRYMTIDLTTERVTNYRLQISVKEHLPWVEYIVNFGWVSERGIWCYVINRVQDRAAVIYIPCESFTPLNCDNGPMDGVTNLAPQIHILHEWRSKYWIPVTHGIHFLEQADADSVEFIMTMAAGNEHEHLFHFVSKLERTSGQCETIAKQLTHGEWNVNTVGINVDHKNKLVYFQGNADSPLENHLYCTSYDKPLDQPVRLTREGHDHSKVTVSIDTNLFVSIYSNLTTPPKCEVYRLSQTTQTRHSLAYLLPLSTAESTSTSPISVTPKKSKLSPFTAQVFSFVNASNDTIYGMLYRPANFDPDKRYPTICYVYGGPSVQVVRNTYELPRSNRHKMYAQLGYAVVAFDNRGSAGRSLNFQGQIKGHLGAVEVEDQVAGLEYVASTFGVINPARVAIEGWSYGGFMSLMALAKRNDIFKVAIVGAPVTDWRLYDTAYTERYLGLPGVNSAGYDNSSVLKYIDGFPDEPDRLLIFHGLIDENVLFYHTTELIDGLTAACKPYNFKPLVQERHGLRSSSSINYYEMTVLNYLERNL